MASSKSTSSELDFTKTQLAVLTVILLLAIDPINPVKMFLHTFPEVAPWHVAAVCILLMVYIFISEMKELLYFGVKIFFHSIISIFLREVEIIGKDNIPRHGPVIFTINHANQFIDGVMILCTCQHKISYLVAEKSWNRPIIGHLAWAMGAVPVKRAQDSAKKGSGTVTLKLKEGQEDIKTELADDKTSSADDSEDTFVPRVYDVTGSGTSFTSELNRGDKIRLPGSPIGLKVTSITDDSNLQVENPERTDISPPENPVSFDVLKRVDQKVVYAKVLDKLASGGAIGIFPEGGSHDRTDLLPLKVGVALIAYSALEKDGLNIPIVPVGLTYFRAYRFRGRATVEYGRPTYIDPKTLSDYKAGGQEKRRVCNELLERIRDSMRSVIISAPDYETMQLIHAARRLYQRGERSASERQDLSRRFAYGYRQLLLMTDGNPPKEWIDLQDRIKAYQKELNELGIRDYQVPGLDREGHIYPYDGDTVLGELRVHYNIAHLLILLVLAAVPSLLLNIPVGLLARFYSNQRRKKALAASKVKVKGFDVMLSEKVLFCIVAVPTLWFIYGLILYFFTDLEGPSIALAILSMPLFSYMGIIVAEAGIVEWKDLRPFVMRLFPSARRRLAVLPATRKQLQDDLRAFIRELGPSLGEIYYGKHLNWQDLQEKARKSTDAAVTSADQKKIQ